MLALVLGCSAGSSAPAKTVQRDVLVKAVVVTFKGGTVATVAKGSAAQLNALANFVVDIATVQSTLTPPSYLVGGQWGSVSISY